MKQNETRYKEIKSITTAVQNRQRRQNSWLATEIISKDETKQNKI
jgi:hypothetical protein